MKEIKLSKRKIRLIELFAGIGAQAASLRDLGLPFEHYRVVEYDEQPLKSYNAIHHTNFKPQNISNIKGKDLGVVDTNKYTYIMTYSFPCTSLSTVGKHQGMRKGSNTSSSLLWEVERLLNELDEKPQILVMENVKQVLSPKNENDFTTWKNFLKSLGYTNYVSVLMGADYGVPQKRERCFMISLLGDYSYEFPKPLNKKVHIKNILEPNVDSRYYLDRNSKKGGRFYAQAFATLDNNNCKYGDTIDAFNMTVNTSGLCNTLTTRPDAFKTSILVVEKDGRLRKLSARETWRLMGFTDTDFDNASRVMNGKVSYLYKQAGNSIIKDVLMHIFKQML